MSKQIPPVNMLPTAVDFAPPATTTTVDFAPPATATTVDFAPLTLAAADVPRPFSKLRIIKNLVMVSLATLLVLGTDDIMTLFQSSMNQEKGLGVASVAVQYASSFISSFFLPKYMILKYGCKTILVLSILLFVPFFAVNYYPVYPLMVLSSVLLGVGFALLWGSIDPYINNLSSLYFHHLMEDRLEGENRSFEQKTKSLDKQTNWQSGHNSFSFSGPCYYIGNEFGQDAKHAKKYNLPNDSFQGTKHSHNDSKLNYFWAMCHKTDGPPDGKESKTNISESTTVRFFAFHSLIYQTCYILSNVVAFSVLRTGYTQNYLPTHNESATCGSAYCNVDGDYSQQNLHPPSKGAWNILTSVCVVLCLLAAFLVVAFVDRLHRKDENVALSVDVLLATFRQMKKKNQLLLVPLNINSGMMKGFYVADFTKSYISCSWGIEYVGLVTICAGTSMVFFSTLSGWFVKHLGRLPIFMLAAILNTALNAILILWQPSPDFPHMYFIAAGMWGGLFGTFHTQVRALHGLLFRQDEEAAFGTYQLWYSVGACLCLSYSNLICNDVKIYLMTIIFTLGMIGYLIVERSYSLECKKTSLQKVIPKPES